MDLTISDIHHHYTNCHQCSDNLQNYTHLAVFVVRPKVYHLICKVVAFKVYRYCVLLLDVERTMKNKSDYNGKVKFLLRNFR